MGEGEVGEETDAERDLGRLGLESWFGKETLLDRGC